MSEREMSHWPLLVRNTAFDAVDIDRAARREQKAETRAETIGGLVRLAGGMLIALVIGLGVGMSIRKEGKPETQSVNSRILLPLNGPVGEPGMEGAGRPATSQQAPGTDWKQAPGTGGSPPPVLTQ